MPNPTRDTRPEPWPTVGKLPVLLGPGERFPLSDVSALHNIRSALTFEVGRPPMGAKQ